MKNKKMIIKTEALRPNTSGAFYLCEILCSWYSQSICFMKPLQEKSRCDSDFTTFCRQRVKSYSTSTLSIDPSCLRLSRCDPSGRSTTRTLHWSTVSKIQSVPALSRAVTSGTGC